MLSEHECTDLIARIEAAKPTLATINRPQGQVVDTSIRNNDRVIFDDTDMASMLMERVRDQVPKPCLGRTFAAATNVFVVIAISQAIVLDLTTTALPTLRL